MPFDTLPQQGPRRHERYIPQAEEDSTKSVESLDDRAKEEHIADALRRYLLALIQAGDFKYLDEVPERFLRSLQRMYQYCERDASRYRALTAPLVGMIVKENAAYLNDDFDEETMTDLQRYERYKHQATVQDFLDMLSSPDLLRFRTIDGVPPSAAQERSKQEFGQIPATIPIAMPPQPPLEYASAHVEDALGRASTWMADKRVNASGESRPIARVAPETGDGYNLSGTDYDTSGFLAPGALHHLEVYGRWPDPEPQTKVQSKRLGRLFDDVVSRFQKRPPMGRDKHVDW